MEKFFTDGSLLTRTTQYRLTRTTESTCSNNNASRRCRPQRRSRLNKTTILAERCTFQQLTSSLRDSSRMRRALKSIRPFRAGLPKLVRGGLRRDDSKQRRRPTFITW